MSFQTMFAQGCYGEVVSGLEGINDPSLPEMHNLAICKYLEFGTNPTQELQKLIDNIRAETITPGAWPTNPSFSLLMYHLALINFRLSQYHQCVSVLNEIWGNYDKIEKHIVLFVALLTIELSIRSHEQSNLENAFSFIQTNFPTSETVSTLLLSKNIDPRIIQDVIFGIQFSKLRVQVANAIKKPISQASRAELESIISTAEAADSKGTLPVLKALPLACAALRLGDQPKYQSILESTDAGNFAVLNNRGLLELVQGRYSSALLHFSRALNARRNSELAFPFHRVAYNIGVPLLMKGKPRSAFRFLHAVVPLMPRSPYLWLRLAEACAAFYKQRVRKLRAATQLSPVIAERYATASRTYSVLPPSDAAVFARDPKEHGDITPAFGERATRNCIALCGDSPTLTPVRHAAELLCAFFALELGDGQRAAAMGRAASADPAGGGQALFLAKIYLAQGELLSGAPEDASRTLSRLIIECNVQRDKGHQVAHALTFARVALATGELPKVEAHLKKAAEPGEHRAEVALAQAELDLHRRHARQALTALASFQAQPAFA